jgi:hypothetical protein
MQAIGKKIRIGAIAAFAAGIMGCATHGEGTKPPFTLVPAGAAKFAPLDPSNPGGIQMALLSGDAKTGPMAFLLKVPKGPAPFHWHSSDYVALTIEGNTRHWLPGQQADAKPNPPGSFWFQPGGGAADAHGDECLSDSCTVFLYMPGKFDFTVVVDKAAPAKP